MQKTDVNSCPVGLDWTTMLEQMGEFGAWQYWTKYKDYPAEVLSTQQFKNKLLIEDEMTAVNTTNLKNRLRQYNEENNTAHHILASKTKGLDRYKINFHVSYFPINLEIQRANHSGSLGLNESITSSDDTRFIVNQSSLKVLTGTLFKKELFDNQLIDLRNKISKLNDNNLRNKIVSVYRVEDVKQIGESTQFNFTVVKYPGILDIEKKIKRSKDNDAANNLVISEKTNKLDQLSLFQKEPLNIKNDTKILSSKSVTPKVLNTIAAKLNELGIPTLVKSSMDLEIQFDKQHSLASAFLKNNIIYLNSDKSTLDSPIHEYTGHIFLNYLKANEPENFEKLITLALQSDIVGQVAGIYPELTDNIDLGQEVFATLIGLENQSKLSERDSSLFQSILKLFKENYIFTVLSDTFKKVFGIENGLEINYNTSLSEIMKQVDNDLFDKDTSLFKSVNQYIKENIKNSLTDTHSQEDFEQQLIDMGLIQQMCKI